MIDLSPALSPPIPSAAQPSAPPGNATGMPPTTFDQTLGAFLDASDAASASAAAGGRQGVADDGKDVPEGIPPQNDDDTPPQGDAGPVWMPTFVAMPLPVTKSVDPTAPNAAGAPTPATATASIPAALSTGRAAPVDLPAASQSAVRQGEAAVALAPVPPAIRPVPRTPASAPDALSTPATTAVPTAPASFSTTADTVSAAPALVVAGHGAAVGPPKAIDDPRPAPTEGPPVAPARTDAASAAIAVSAVPQPAGQVFAAAIATASSWRARGTRSGEREPTDVATALPTAPTAIADRVAVQATGDAHNTALDLTRDSGLQGMIDRIETLRDDASDGINARDTRVRLTPDALGSVDVAVRQQGDRVHVTFTAEQDATRALIADAQPRLTELAAARGVRIGDTSVGTGSGGNGTSPQPQTQTNPRFARAPDAVASETDSTPSDHRLA